MFVSQDNFWVYGFVGEWLGYYVYGFIWPGLWGFKTFYFYFFILCLKTGIFYFVKTEKKELTETQSCFIFSFLFFIIRKRNFVKPNAK